MAGNSPAASVMPTPTASATITVRSREDAVGRRQLDTESAEQPLDRLRQEHAEAEADERGEEADDERLEDHRAEDLPPRGADRPQRRELARALGDGDREGVEDDERADEERDAGEDERGSSGRSP